MTSDFRSLCKKVYDFRNGNPPYDFRHLSPYDRDTAAHDAFSHIMEEIRVALENTENQPTADLSDLADLIIERVCDRTDNDVVLDFSNLEKSFNEYTLRVIAATLKTTAYNCEKFCFDNTNSLNLSTSDLFWINTLIHFRLNFIADIINKKISEVNSSQENDS
jgi:6-pyruvoyl-tetrahydropterin synthase